MTTVQPTTDTAMERMSPRALLAAIALAVDLPMPYDVRIDPRLGILHIQLTTFAAAAVWAQESGSTLEHHMCEGGERHWVGSDQLGRWNDWETDISAFEDLARGLAGVQWHPEVLHSENDQQVLEKFLFDVAGCRPTWTSANIVEEQVALIREQVGDKRVICALSGGVDSAVAGALVQRAIGDQLTCVFVDHGLLRKGEAEQVERDFVAVTGVDLKVEEWRLRSGQKIIEVSISGPRNAVDVNQFKLRVVDKLTTKHAVRPLSDSKTQLGSTCKG